MNTMRYAAMIVSLLATATLPSVEADDIPVDEPLLEDFVEEDGPFPCISFGDDPIPGIVWNCWMVDTDAIPIP